MADGVNIDWGLLKQPDYAGDYANAFQMGRQLAAQKISDQASTAYGMSGAATGPPPPPQPSGGADGVMQQLPASAGSGGSIDIQALLANQSDQERQGAAQKAEAITAMLHGLQGSTPDPQQRLLMAQHLAATAPSLGIMPGKITISDVTDQGIAGHLASVVGLQRQLQMQDQRVQRWQGGAQGVNAARVGMPFPPPQAAVAPLRPGGRGSAPTSLGQQHQVNTHPEGGVRYIGPIG